MSDLTIHIGDCREVLRSLPADSVQCCVSSPPYWGLRDYGVRGQIGHEADPETFIAELVGVFREVRRVLKPDGTCWINMGDCYAGGGNGGGGSFAKDGIRAAQPGCDKNVPARRGSRGVTTSKSKRIERGAGRWGGGNNPAVGDLKPKDLVGQPWMLAFALRADGWYLRRDIIWHKPNAMPESVKDRPATAHEYLFLLSKSQTYYYDGDAIAEPVSPNTHARLSQDVQNQIGSARANGGARSNGNMKAVGRKTRPGHDALIKNNASMDAALAIMPDKRNKRSVWTVATGSYEDAHFATYPPALIRPCILAGTRPGDEVLDPFAGSGTTGAEALELGRKARLIELNPEYRVLIEQRCHVTRGLGI